MTAAAQARLESGESAERGRAARQATPRSAHGDWAPAPDRPDPIAAPTARGGLARAAARPHPLRMLVSPFTFYRGAAAVMAADLAAMLDSGIVVQACGDAHIELRRIRSSGPQTPVPRLLTRRCPARGGVGRQVDGGQRGDSRRGRRLPAHVPAADRHAACESTVRGYAASRARATWTSGTSASTRASGR